ncbi:MAG: T9SS type A sorting domain-containing protein [Saprospiraceae bacterium]|nr:T9SS type A sorting domain-containing protein [Saprospiraceae bacterium]
MHTRKLIVFLAVCLPAWGWSQATLQNPFPKVAKLEKAPYNKNAILHETAVPEPEQVVPVYQSGVNYRSPEEYAGFTRIDAQSYGCMPSRLYADNDGNPVATWIFGTDLNGVYPERGTGYNVRNNGAWPEVTSRIESVRTGFPAVARLNDGTELIVAHATGTTPYSLVFSRKAPGASNWTETSLPLPPGAGCLWPRIAVGGQNGNFVHIIAITTPVANTGTVYEGVDGHVLYWRSSDGGLTWDKQASIIPGLDNSKYAIVNADSYTIDANDDAVAVAVLPDWNDLRVFKSVDNGDSWDIITVNDFPDALENYAGLAGESYSVDDVPFDPEAPDSLSVFSSDGFGSLLIDDNAECHLWFGRMYYVDNDIAAGTFYFPGINGLVYWKESFNDELRVITGALDYDGDTALAVVSITEIGPYFNSLSSFPSAGIADDGTIYLAYSALHELYRTGSSSDKDQFYRHTYLMKSEDGGENWGEPFDIISDPYVFIDFIPFVESVWPAVPRHMGDKIWVLYQQDNLPGTDLWGDNHDASDNGITWVEIDNDSVPAYVNNFEPARPDATFEISLSPNPVSSVTQLSATFQGSDNASIEVFDAFGRMVYNQRLSTQSGRQTFLLPVQHLTTGAYIVRVQEGSNFATVRMVKS